MRFHFLIRTHVLILCFAVLLLLSLYIFNDASSHGGSYGSTSTSIVDYISRLRGLTEFTENQKIGATSVLVLTYMRSGSSLTGDILQQATDSFYVYEPFRTVAKKTTAIVYANGSLRLPPFDMEDVKNDALVNWFTCEIEKLPKSSLTDIFMKFGNKTKQMTECLNKYKLAQVPENERFRLCGNALKEACLNSPVRIIKTIRMELKSVSHLLETLPNMKILHLVRDPRATLDSQKHLGRCTAALGGQPGCTQSHCKRVEDDVLEEERLLKLYPDRIKPVFYEDIAKYPLETSRQMFDFIGETFTREAHAYVFNITMAGNDNNCIICTTRSNSSEHIDSWKKTMNADFLNIVQERCNYILKRYEYKLVDTNNRTKT